MRLFIMLLAGLLTVSVHATELTDKNVRLWLDTMPALQEWLDQNEDKLPQNDTPDANFDMDAAFRKGVQDLKDAGLYNEFSRRVKAAGFSNVEQWVSVTQKISMAYTAIMMDQQPDNRAAIEEQLNSIRSSKHVPPEEKAMLEGMLMMSLNMLKAVEAVPAADKKRLQPYLTELAEQFGDNEEEY